MNYYDNTNEAKWIWYPGEFEFLLYHKVMHRRIYRDKMVIPGWRVDRVYDSITFKREFNLLKPARVYIEACGELAVFIGNRADVVEDFCGFIDLPAGPNMLFVSVHNPSGLPCILVWGGIESGAGWHANYGTNKWSEAEYRDFGDRTYTPNDYSLPVKREDYIRKEQVENGILYEFEHEIMAFTVFNADGSSDVKLFYGESRREALDTEYCETFEKIEVYAPGTYKTGCARAYRYLFVAGVHSQLYALKEYRPMTQRGYFNCSDERINRIYEMSLRTLELNSRELLLDGIKRDRWVWAGDIYAGLYYNYYTFFDIELIESSIIALYGKYAPEIHINYILDYSFYMIMVLSEHYRFTGRYTFIEKMFDKAVTLLEFCLKDCSKHGYIGYNNIEEVWLFIDWAKLDNRGECAFYQILLLESLLSVAKLADLIGDNRGKKYLHIAQKLQSTIPVDFWVSEEKCFAHSRTDAGFSSQNTRYADIFAVRTGFADERMSKAIETKLMGSEAQEITTPYMKAFELDAMGRLGRAREVVAAIKHYWSKMLDAGADCVWEEYSDGMDGSQGAAVPGHRYGMSLCHMWGAGPLLLLPAYVAGITPAADGFSMFEIKPALDIFEEWDTAVPAAGGLISASYKGGILKIYSDKADGLLRLKKEYVLPSGNLVEGRDEGDFYCYELKAGVHYRLQVARTAALCDIEKNICHKAV